MTRRSAMAMSVGLALCMCGVVALLSALLASGRQRGRQGYREAAARQSRQVAAVHLAEPNRPAPDQRDLICVRGAETFASAVAESLATPLISKEGDLDLRALQMISHDAVLAERHAERAAAGPALPQRMGRHRVVDPSGAGTWTSIQPPEIDCNGTPAYAAFRRPPR